jgi:hypothetical protein
LEPNLTQMEELITIEKYNNILKMMQSPDEETKMMGLTLVEQSAIKRNLGFVLMLKKQGYITNEMWKKNAPETMDQMKELSIDPEQVLYFQTINEILLKNKVAIEQVQFVLDHFAKFLKKEMVNSGYDNISDILITININQSVHVDEE